jgi:signal transduction histidine kinase
VRSRWSALDVAVRDAVVALLLTLAVQVELVLAADEVEGSLLLQHAAFTVMTASVALRRRAPLAAAVLASLGLAGQTLVGSAPVAAGIVVLFIVVYSVATYASRRDAVLGLLAVLLGVALYPFVVDDVLLVDEFVNAMIPTVVWVLARVARERLDRAVGAERERIEQERAAERTRELALADQRRQIARELHDTVAHGVTLMLLQTEVLRNLHGDSEPLEVVQAAGRSCVDDLRRLLVVLRSPDEPAPQPCRRSSSRCARPARRSSCARRRSRQRCRRAWTWPCSAWSRRDSPTPCATPAAATCASPGR